MKLHGVNILDIGMLKQNFSLQGLYPCVDNGTLLTFEESAPVRDSFLAGEIRAVLCALRDGQPPDFALSGRLEPDLLRRRLLHTDSSFSAYTRDAKTKQDFFDRSWAQIVELVAPLCTSCTAGQAWRFYLCILLHVQSRPKLPLQQADADFLAHAFAAPADRPAPAETAPGAFRADRLCLCGEQLLFLSDGRLYALDLTTCRWSLLRGGPVRSFACTPTLGLITVDPAGTVHAPVRPDLCRQAEGTAIQAVTAYGDRYVLLTQDGRLLSNLKLPDSLRWQQVRQLRLGLNSLSAVAGELCAALQYGSDPALHDFTGIRSLHTRTDGARRYAVLRENGDLFTDMRDKPIPRVQAACLSPQGYFYADSRCLIQIYFNDIPRSRLVLPKGSGYQAQEICADEHRAVVLYRAEDRDILMTSWQKGPLPALPEPDDCPIA